MKLFDWILGLFHKKQKPTEQTSAVPTESSPRRTSVDEKPPNEEDKIEEMSFLIIGLGNPGAEYDGTRHNIGFDVLDYLAKEKELNWESEKHVFKSDFRFKGKVFHLIKPITFMNLSGKAVRYWMQQLKIPKERILVVVDDLALPLGKLRLRKKGSPGGHNGLKHIDQILGHNQYPRLRFGIGDDYRRGQQVDFVLGKWKNKELDDVEEGIREAAEVVLKFGTIGIDRAMNNKKK